MKHTVKISLKTSEKMHNLRQAMKHLQSYGLPEFNALKAPEPQIDDASFYAPQLIALVSLPLALIHYVEWARDDWDSYNVASEFNTSEIEFGEVRDEDENFAVYISFNSFAVLCQEIAYLSESVGQPFWSITPEVIKAINEDKDSGINIEFVDTNPGIVD